MRKYDILMLIKTLGLDFDDRVRKECSTLSNMGKKVKIIALEDSNTKRKGQINDNVSYMTFGLFTRKIFPHKRFLFFKLIEMNLKFILFSSFYRKNTIWIHNFELLGVIPYFGFLKKTSLIQRVVWDQHELITKKSLNRKYFKYRIPKCFKISDIIISANKERKKLLKKEFNLQETKCYVIENFVDAEFSKIKVIDLPLELKTWLNNREFLLAQGGASRSRYFEELCQAILKIKKFKLVVVGPYNKSQIDFLSKNFKNEYEQWIYFTGLVNQIEIPIYIDSAYASIVFYSKNDSMNLVLCAPNRLYQALSRGVPIIVGDNPPMKAIVDKYKNGIVLNSDGRNIDDIIDAIVQLHDNYDTVKKNALLSRNIFNWENQIETFHQIFNKQL